MKKTTNKIVIVLLILLALFVGINIGGYFQLPIKPAANTAYQPSIEGLVAAEPRINFTTVHLIGGCYIVSFDVTTDQAYSIARGLEKSLGTRPLTHDILKDILENFGVEILQIKIDRYDNGIYYATIILRQDNRILELDARPSDSIALALRTGNTLYFTESILEANGNYIC